MVSTTSNGASTARIASRIAASQAARCSDEQIAGKHRGDLLLAVQRDVHREVDADHPGDLADVVVDRIALGDAPRRVRMADALGVVQHQHRLETRQPGRHHLRARR